MNKWMKSIIEAIHCNSQIFVDSAYFEMLENFLLQRKSFNKKIDDLMVREIKLIKKENANNTSEFEDETFSEMVEINKMDRETFVASQIVFLSSLNEKVFKNLYTRINSILADVSTTKPLSSQEKEQEYKKSINKINNKLKSVYEYFQLDVSLFNLDLQYISCFQKLSNKVKHDKSLGSSTCREYLLDNKIINQSGEKNLIITDEIKKLDFIIDQYLDFYQSVRSFFGNVEKELERFIIDKLPEDFDFDRFCLAEKVSVSFDQERFKISYSS